ncbi:MAG: hypothetical protein IJY31_00135 [Muribaculaceae bacterium]|nr:hypothetical protein [Muribaculaceae bacterium]
MKAIPRHIKAIAILIPILLSSCGDDEPYNSSAELADIVTYKETTPNGAIFTFQRQNDSPEITLTAAGRQIDESLYSPGCRVLISYYPANGEPYSSGNITLTGISAINNGVLKTGDTEKLSGWDTDDIYLNSIWRTGTFINIYFRVDQSSEKRRFALMMDEATSGDDIPQLYLIHDMLGQPDNFTRRAYASFDISAIWDKPECQGVTIHLNDSNLETDTYTFTK